ncbi:MAG: segregation/condensation protein A [Clostridia bacterium]|nr:segregation/condensation protein A [Clostridia bacterium]
MALTYKIEQFEGPLDLLLSLIAKNKVNIEDIPISLICDQYMEYINEAQRLDMELASEFILMASELMLIKSKMLLPRNDEDEEDPRAVLTDALIRYQQAKAAALQFAPLYAYYSGRLAKDTDEVSVDRSFVADQDPMSLCTAVRRIIANTNAEARNSVQVFHPMIKKPIVPVEVKIVGILKHIDKNRGSATLDELLSDSVSLPDMIAIFIGVLELVKVRRLLISESDEDERGIHGVTTTFTLNENEDDIIKEESAENFND